MIVFRWNETLKEFLKTTIIGGASFLLPMALVLFILSYALRLVKRIAEPISHSLRLDQLGAAAGVGAATVLSAVVLVLIAFAAGIVARTAVGRRITDGRKALFSARWHHSHQILAAGRQAGAGEALSRAHQRPAAAMEARPDGSGIVPAPVRLFAGSRYDAQSHRRRLCAVAYRAVGRQEARPTELHLDAARRHFLQEDIAAEGQAAETLE